jgi:hypothetical protein
VQKTTVRTVDIKINLGGEEKKRERDSREMADKRDAHITSCKGRRS